MHRSLRLFATTLIAAASLFVTAAPGLATPVCTDGHGGGPPLAACGGRVFPESHATADYVQYLPQPGTDFREFQHGIEALAAMYPQWVSVYTLRDHYGTDDAVSAGPDRQISYWESDTGDGFDIWVIKLTDHEIPDEGKQTLLFSLSVHGDEKGGIEGGLRTVEDLAIAAEDGGKIADGVEGYESTTGVEPQIHEHEVADVLAQEAVYFVAYNIDGWVTGETTNTLTGDGSGTNVDRLPLYSRGNYRGTDLNRQMPTVGRINSSRNPLEEAEMLYGHRHMHEVADQGIDGLMAYGADVHGEGQSRAWADIMYPAGQFDSIKHRQLMAIAERTKSVMDDTLFLGVIDVIEENTGGDSGEGLEDSGAPRNTIMTKPARWGTVWDTLGYTDTGFIGDYMANELGVTGMDYEIALNHSDFRAYGRPWSVLLQENYINATRAIIKTAMAYALYQDDEFATFEIDTGGKAGYLFNPDTVTDTDEDGVGTLPGPAADGIGRNGEPVEQVPYDATPMRFFEDTSNHVAGGLDPVLPADVAADAAALDAYDSLVIADIVTPEDPEGRAYDVETYVANLKSWVEAGGNLILTDRALHLLDDLGVVETSAIDDINVYQPYANFTDFSHPLLAGLRPNARQLAEFTLIGYGIGNNASPMTTVTTSAWEGAGGTVVGTTGPGSGNSDDGSRTSVGEVPVGDGVIRILGGGLHMATEEQDHRYGLKDYSLTYTGLYILENAMKYDAPGIGVDAPDEGSAPGALPLLGLLPVLGAIGLRRRRPA
ncbi:MAG: hypothetical protein KY469_12015 [Actinobacteria bacterium]|nr:hypothetical protein [Actinomycetota bacterium]